MKIKLYGTRGSIPVCGSKYVKYGGNTTCISIVTSTSKKVIIIDCGSGIKDLGKELIKKKIKDITILLTHQHWDHIIGFPFFAPIYEKGVEIKILGCSYFKNDVKGAISKIMKPPNFPLTVDEIIADLSFYEIKPSGLEIDGVNIIPIELSHPNGGLGYRFNENGRSLVILTDNELKYKHPGGKTFDDYIAFSESADILIADADLSDNEYNEKKGWGHSTYTHAFELAADAKVKKLILFHHNQDRTDKEIDYFVSYLNEKAKRMKIAMKIYAGFDGMEINL